MGKEFIAVGLTILFLIVTSLPLGRYIARVFTGERTLLDPIFLPIERLVLRLTGVDPDQQQDWKQYSVSLLTSNVIWSAYVCVACRASSSRTVHVMTGRPSALCRSMNGFGRCP